jgi:uncharacterized integral membrane protein
MMPVRGGGGSAPPEAANREVQAVRIFVFLAVALAALVAFFSIQNAQSTRVSFFSWHVEAPLVILLLGTFVAGAAAAWLALLPGAIRRSLEIARLTRERNGAVPPPPAPAPPDGKERGGEKGGKPLPPPPGNSSPS